VYAEDLTEAPKEESKPKRFFAADKGSKIIFSELIAVCVLAAAIFLTNIFMPSSAINTFIGSLTSKTPAVVEPTYSEIKLSPVISELSDAEVTMTDSGVICFTGATGVYPVCAGTVSSISEDNGLYTVKIDHTSTFSSVITGLKTVYSAKGDVVKANLPFAYSDGQSEVRVSMYDGETLLNCYQLSGEVPVWNS
ncbi:MAG: M23 family metallopeptidase, partial [Clostridia bacterium]|nr:M23 family metallopeptidase [Clostridia bacterium]